MKLNDARRYAVLQRLRVRFALSNGFECILSEHGVAQVPGLKEPAGFSIEEEFGKAERFTLEPLLAGSRKSAAESVSRSELSSRIGGGASEAGHGDHDDDE